MYNVDTKGIEQRLQFMEQLRPRLSELAQGTDILHQLAVERAVHVTIEAITDVGNALIDGFIMRDPGSYADIIDILSDQKVFSMELADRLKPLVTKRKALVQEYYALDQEKVYALAKEAEAIIPDYCSSVRAYLKQELF